MLWIDHHHGHGKAIFMIMNPGFFLSNHSNHRKGLHVKVVSSKIESELKLEKANNLILTKKKKKKLWHSIEFLRITFELALMWPLFTLAR